MSMPNPYLLELLSNAVRDIQYYEQMLFQCKKRYSLLLSLRLFSDAVRDIQYYEKMLSQRKEHYTRLLSIIRSDERDFPDFFQESAPMGETIDVEYEIVEPILLTEIC